MPPVSGTLKKWNAERNSTERLFSLERCLVVDRDDFLDLGSLKANRRGAGNLGQEGGNVLLLDEPTNDLDTETLGALEDALENFAGCAVIISHDRMFLDRLATHILAFEGDSHVEWFEGNFEDYEQDKIRRREAESASPKRVTYKRLIRPLTTD